MKKKYEKVASGKNLPKFDVLDREFNLLTIDKEAFSLREIRTRIIEKLSFYEKVLEEILSPDDLLAATYEAQTFTKKDIEKVYNLFRKIHKKIRESMYLSIDSNENKEVEFINSGLDFWKNIKPELTEVIDKLNAAWEDEKKSAQQFQKYFG